MIAYVVDNVRKLWSASGFDDSKLAGYAERLVFTDTRTGLTTLAMVNLFILLSSATLFYVLAYERIYSQTFLLLALLSLHIMISSRYIQEVRVLNMLGLTLVVIIGTAFVLLAQYAGKFNPLLLANVVLLFMVIPLIPWALREALLAVGTIYVIFSVSTVSVDGRFKADTIYLLQFLMISAGFATLAVIIRQVTVRKHDIATRYMLENAHRDMEALSYKDPLTGAYNRRYLQREFDRIRGNFRANRHTLHFTLVDFDNFKQLNDTQGHDVGDKALQVFSETLLEGLEVGDYLFRLGGDEFALIFAADSPDDWLTQQAAACERNGLPLQFSTGVASLKQDQDAAFADLYNLADRRLYANKRRRKALQADTRGHSEASFI